MTQPSDVAHQPSPTPKPAKSPLKRLAAITLLALLTGTTAADITFHVQPNQFQCTGIIHIKPDLPPIILSPSATMPRSAYDEFMDSQVVALQGERYAEKAMFSPRWLGKGTRSTSPDAISKFRESIHVDRQGELILVSFLDPDPNNASDAVAALIEAYQQLAINPDPDNTARILAKLGDLKSKYEDARQRMAARITILSEGEKPELIHSQKIPLSAAIGAATFLATFLTAALLPRRR